MALIQQCERCKDISDNFETVDDLPDGWQYVHLRVRGSQGDWTGEENRVICGRCSEQLYAWFHMIDAPAHLEGT